MERRTLGRTGISVSELGLGAMMLGSLGNTTHDESTRIVHAALEAGINLIDTADYYSHGESETIVGKTIRHRRDDVVLASKFGLPFGADPNEAGGSRRWITRALEATLRRLGTDHLDLYQMHRPDPETDIDETLGALSDLVRSGKVRAIGSSTFAAESIVEAQWVAERRGHVRFRSEQLPYSILTRGVEAGVFPTIRRHGMGALVYSPLASGWLAGRKDPTTTRRATQSPGRFDLSTPGNQAKLAALERLIELAEQAGMPLAHLAIAFAASHPAVSTVLLGPRTPDQLDSLISAADTRLDDDLLDRIDEIVPPGTDVNRDDIYAPNPALDVASRRRNNAR